MTKTKREDTEDRRGWEPVLNGRIYCSPRCGGNCTKEAFDHATTRADALAKRAGPGWVPRVWENLGWYYAATMEGDDFPYKVQIFESKKSRDHTYHVLMNGVYPSISEWGTNLAELLMGVEGLARKKINDQLQFLDKLHWAGVKT